MTKLVRIDKYTNDDKVPTPANIATYRYISIFNDDDTIDSIIQRAKNGFIDTDKKSILYYEGDEMPPLGEEATEYNDKREPAGSSKGGQFANKDGGSADSKKKEFIDKLKKNIIPSKEFQNNQKEVDKEITGKVWDAIDKLHIRQNIHSVAMQGSYEKGTDLPASGSDLDLFVVFNTDVPESIRQDLGVKIGKMALDGKNSYTQTATTKYEEAFFEHNGQMMEVQVVPIRHLTLEQIQDKKVRGHDINIGMERTPHQTVYMKEALKGKTEEVRMLKQFMKDTGLYDSSMKSQGFSGYSAEVLVDKFGSFEDTLKFFANMKEGDIVDKFGKGKRNSKNLFSLIDPIDPNRDLISAFSDVKIGRTIETAKHFLKTGEKPTQSKPAEMKSVTVKFDNTQGNEDTLVGQSRKSQKSLVKQLNRMGFDVKVNKENVNGMDIDVPRSKMNELDGEVSLTFGVKEDNIPATYKDKGVPLRMEKAVQAYRDANPTSKFLEENGRLKAIKGRQFTNIADALKHLTTTKIDEAGMSDGTINDMRKGVRISTKDKDEFENLI